MQPNKQPGMVMMNWKRFLHSVFAVSCLQACAPTLKDFAFEASNPLAGKRIGVFYDRKIIGTFQGLDERDSREYLTSLAAALERFSSNAAFLDMTRSGEVISGYKPFTVKRTGFLAETTAVDYLVPESGVLREYADSLDYVLVMQNLSAMKEVAVKWRSDHFPTDPFGKSVPLGGMTFQRMHVVETDSQEVAHLGYILWDFKKEAALGHEKNSLSKQDFMDGKTTFSQDAELMSQKVLRELQAAFPSGRRMGQK